MPIAAPTTSGPDRSSDVQRILAEDVLTLSEARAEIARVTGRRCRPDKATMHRWIRRGVHGVRLEAIRIGAQWLTSRQSVTRFVAARTAANR